MNKYTLAFDIESTGLSTELDRIVSICMVRKDTGEEFYTTVNPEIPIPVDSTKVHGLTDEDVKDSPRFTEILPHVESLVEGAEVLQAYNGSKFDVYMLQEELNRAGSKCSVLKTPLIDDLRTWQEGEPRKLEHASVRWLGHGIDNAHNASADVHAMIAVSELMRKEFGFDKMTDLELAAMLKGDKVTPDGKYIWKDGRVMMNWSKKYFGRPLIEVAKHDPGFLQFVLSKDGDWMNHGVRSVAVNAIKNHSNESDFNNWVISIFGPPQIDCKPQSEITNTVQDVHLVPEMKGSNRVIRESTSMYWRILGNAAGQVKTYGKKKFNELTKSSAEYICSEFKNEDISDWAMDYVHAPEGGNLTVEAWLEKYDEERLHLLGQLVSLIEGRERVFQELWVCPVCGVLDSEEGGNISASGGRIVNTSGGGEDGGWQRCGCDSCDYELNYETY